MSIITIDTDNGDPAAFRKRDWVGVSRGARKGSGLTLYFLGGLSVEIYISSDEEVEQRYKEMVRDLEKLDAAQPTGAS